MNTDGMLIVTLVLATVGLLLLVLAQAKQIRVLQEHNQRLRPNENHDELIVLAQGKLETVGFVKTVKFVREQTGMSLVEAKQFVDRLQQ